MTKALAVYAGVNDLVFLVDLPGASVVLAMTTVLYLLVLNFFRSPARAIVVDDDVVISPADGRVVVIEETVETEYLKRPCLQVSVFMNIFNVHINWFAVNGMVTYVKHHRGRHAAAYLPKSSTGNERATVVMRLPRGEEIVSRQIAGAMARRVVTYAAVGKEARQDRHVGFIKFGSRVDLFLPLDTRICVRVGEKVTGGRTIIGTFNKHDN